jgi:hypothetical protein
MRIAIAFSGVALSVVLVVSLVQGAASDLESMVTPSYTDDGALERPDDYREWVFVGASLGLSYSEELTREGPGRFHHVYMQPEAYRHYRENGTFPEKTMLVMENYSAGSKVNPNLHGHFEDERVGLEVALKDSDQFEDGWAYFMFSTPNGLRETAKAFPKQSCYDCHAQHAADDNVFVQFYPILREAKVESGGEDPKQ